MEYGLQNHTKVFIDYVQSNLSSMILNKESSKIVEKCMELIGSKKHQTLQN